MEGWRLGGWETNKERRRRKPADGALVSEGFSSETDPAAVEKKKVPRRTEGPAGFVGTGRISRVGILASALGPA
jgi:hypothetical protein